MTHTYTQLKTAINFCENLFSTPDHKEVLSFLADKEIDFTVNDVRFIKTSEIDQILADELESDLYTLGCFTAWFIADQTKLPIEMIEACQKSEAYEALGEGIKATCDMLDFAKAFVSADGYGHHFNGYDGSEEEINLLGTDYIVFDNH